jgi:hypothetical protein
MATIFSKFGLRFQGMHFLPWLLPSYTLIGWLHQQNLLSYHAVIGQVHRKFHFDNTGDFPNISCAHS